MSGGLLWVENGDPIFKAFIFFRQVGSMVEILSMATHPDFRQKGVMRELFLDFILRFCKPAQVIEIWLEVHEKNSAALKAYGSLGFITTGERPNYYQDRARAILMTYPLAKSE